MAKEYPLIIRLKNKLHRYFYGIWCPCNSKGQMGKKKDTCLKVVNSKKFKDIYKAYSFNPRAINEAKEADNLYKLVGDARQRPFFKKRFYKYERTQQQMHQEHIDKIR